MGFKSSIVVIIFVMFLSIAFIPCLSMANTIYVPADYITIQGAINAANDGDTILVNSGYYNENVAINKAISLVGEDSGSGLPIIDGNRGIGVSITADGVTLQGFNVTNADQGVYVASYHNSVAGITAYKNNIGICIYGSFNDVTGNIASNNTKEGIELYFTGHDNVTGNLAQYNYDGITLIGSSGNDVNNNTVCRNTEGINLAIGDNYYDIGAPGSFNNITGNIINNNSYYGIYLNHYYTYNNITGNLIADNKNIGIRVNGSSYNTYAENTITGSYSFGIYLEAGSNYNDLINNVADNNSYDGIYLYNSSYNNLTGNTANNNSNNAGILISAFNNNLTGNTASGNHYGIQVQGWDNSPMFNVVNNNTLWSNSIDGLYIYGSNNSAMGNVIENNGIGVFIDYYMTYVASKGNVLWLNTIRNNSVNARSDPYQNNWNSTMPLQYVYNRQEYTNYTGNYWGDYSGSDVNGCGIGDTPYVVSTNNVDYYPMTLTTPSNGPVKNLRSGLTFNAIQDAINDNNTANGDTIQVNSGNYYENLIVNKSVRLIGVDTGDGMPALLGNGNSNGVDIIADGVTLQGFEIINGNSNGMMDEGVYIESNDNVVTGNRAHDNVDGIVIRYGSSNNTVSGNTAYNNGDGILIQGSNNNVSGNTAYNNCDEGILLGGSYNNVSGNTANYNNPTGIRICNSSNNVSGNTFNYNTYGILMSQGSNNSLSGNTVNGNIYIGICIWSGSYGNILRNNSMSGNLYNFFDDSQDLGTYVDTSNLVDGKPIYFLVGASDIVLDEASNAGTVYLLKCHNITVKNLTLVHNYYGVYALHSDNCLIEDNNASNDEYGIRLYGSSGSIVSGNTANYDGYYYDGCGIDIGDYSSNNTVSGNTANYGSNYGIWLFYSTNNGVVGNTANHNMCGILAQSSNYNNLTRNVIENNSNTGIWICWSSGNVIWLNLLDGNSPNAQSYQGYENMWNSTVPLDYSYNGHAYTNYTGNYWGDYIGVDANGDGVGDSQFAIDTVMDTLNVDYYPMVKSTADNASFDLPLKRGWNLVSSPIVVNPSINVSAFKNTSVTMVAQYNCTTGGFDIYRVGKTPTAFPFIEGQGYFLYCGNDTVYTISGLSEPGQSAVLGQGWNLIGWTNLTATNSKTLAQGLQNVTMLARYNTATGSYDIYRVGKTPTPFEIKAGEGYFLYTTYVGQQTLAMG